MFQKTAPLTQGNLKNNHVYLGKALGLFPPEVIGGSNITESGTKVLFKYKKGTTEICFTSDIAGDKKIIRARSWVKDFIECTGKKIGDQVIITKVSPTEYHLS